MKIVAPEKEETLMCRIMDKSTREANLFMLTSNRVSTELITS
jgi:hypothetical protein